MSQHIMISLLKHSLVALLLVCGSVQAQAQLAACPLAIAPKIVSDATYKVVTPDNCWWIMFTNANAVTVQLPAPGLIFPAGFTTTILPLNGAALSFTGLPDDAGVVHKINGVSTIALPAGQGAILKIQQDMNWYAIQTSSARTVVGAVSTTINEPAVWGNTSGTLLKDGAGVSIAHSGKLSVTGTSAGPFIADGADLGVFSQSSATANALYIWRCAISSTCTNPTSIGNYDAIRAVAGSPATQTVDLVNGVGSYVMNSSPRPNPPGGFPVTAAFNGTIVCDAAYCGSWGINTIVTDNRGQTLTLHPEPRYIVGGEFDTQAMSANTRVSGVIIGGTSKVQPATADGFNCLYLDGSAAAGTIAKWNGCYESQDGAAQRFAIIGSVENNGVGNLNGQILELGFFEAAGAANRRVLQISATPGGLFFATTSIAAAANIVLPASAAFATGDLGGLNINSRTAVVGNAGTISFAPATTWTTAVFGNATSNTAIIGSAVSMTGLGVVAAGTVKRFLCIDTETKIVYEGSGASCN